MAITLDEQRQAFDTPALRVKVRQALFVTAHGVLVEATGFTNHVNRTILARQVLFGASANDLLVDAFLRDAIAANAGAANLNAVQTASDALVQAAVNASFDNFANGQ